MKKLFIWDFHGTLEKKGSEDVALEYTNMALEELGYARRLTREENFKLYGIPWYRFFEYLFPGESHEQHLEIQNVCLRIEQEHKEVWDRHLKPNDNAREVIATIYKSGHDQILISNTEESVIKDFICFVGLAPYFPEGKYFATNSNLGSRTTKYNILKKYLDGQHFDHFIAVGDRSQDLKCVQEYPNTTYLYAHPGKEFVDYPATHRIRDLREVLREI